VVGVAGAASGIGRATAGACAAQGARLVLAARGVAALEAVRLACTARGAEATAVAVDIADPEDIARLVERATGTYGRIDVWVQIAAMAIAGPFGSESVPELRRLLDTNVLGNVVCARAALSVFDDQDEGVLVIVGSLLGVFPNPRVPVYSMTKYAVRGLAINLQHELASRPGIDVCLVMPGPVDTPLFARAGNHTGKELRAIPPAYAPERLAAAIVSCARRPRSLVTAGVVPHLALAAHRVAPRLSEWMVARWSANTLVRSTSTPETTGALFTPPAVSEVHGGHRRGRTRRRLGALLGEP